MLELITVNSTFPLLKTYDPGIVKGSV